MKQIYLTLVDGRVIRRPLHATEAAHFPSFADFTDFLKRFGAVDVTTKAPCRCMMCGSKPGEAVVEGSVSDWNRPDVGAVINGRCELCAEGSREGHVPFPTTLVRTDADTFRSSTDGKLYAEVAAQWLSAEKNQPESLGHDYDVIAVDESAEGGRITTRAYLDDGGNWWEVGGGPLEVTHYLPLRQLPPMPAAELRAVA